jgi:predicted amidophosphoribosyltransferase
MVRPVQRRRPACPPPAEVQRRDASRRGDRQRGYDQAELIARSAARELSLPSAPILERSRATIAQFDLDRATRATNVRGAFRLKPIPRSRFQDDRPLQGRWIVLVDDVVTTGATLTACAEPLLAAGAVGVSAVTVARER